MAAAPGNQQETEIKVRAESAGWARARLEAAGFAESTGRVFERNLLFDSAAAPVRSAGRLLRVRTAGGRAILTFKGPAVVTAGGHKTREELETPVGDAEVFEQILTRLGYAQSGCYEKFRTEFTWNGHPGGAAMLDETPIGVYVEFEGDAAWIDRAAAAVGFSTDKYILDSYFALFRKYCEANAIPSGRDLVFRQSP
ncbi:MAG: class IV adenylate cyclase [Bryobacterales bacterium]|nr:class IV adenylate cyclase [Bryobacterales bacterium]